MDLESWLKKLEEGERKRIANQAKKLIDENDCLDLYEIQLNGVGDIVGVKLK